MKSVVSSSQNSTAAHGSERTCAAVSIVQRQVLHFAVAACLVNLAVPFGVVIYARLTDQYYWHLFWGEGNFITWFSSVQLLCVAAVAAGNHMVGRLARRLDGFRLRHDGIWLIFALGFVFLALDERFEIHETVRDQFLIPRGMFSHVPGVKPGDIGLYVYLVYGLVLTFFLVRELRRRSPALHLFIAAVVLIGATSIVDSLPPELEHRLSFFWTSAFEETGELWAELLFLLSFLVVLRGRLGWIADPRTSEPFHAAPRRPILSKPCLPET